MSHPPTLTLTIPPSPPKNIPTTQPSRSSTQTHISHPILSPPQPTPPQQSLPKRSLFRQSFTWTPPRHSTLPTDEILSPRTTSTKAYHDEAFQMKLTTRRGACVWPKLGFHTDGMQLGGEVWEPHPGRRVDFDVDVGDEDGAGGGDGEEGRSEVEEEEEEDEEEWMTLVRQYHSFLRASVVDTFPTTNPGKGKSLHTTPPIAHLQPSQQNHNPPQPLSPPLPYSQPPHHPPLPIPSPVPNLTFDSPPLAREKSNASTASSSSVETFITHVRESFAWRGSRDFTERREEGIFKDEKERGWEMCGGVLESSVGVERGCCGDDLGQRSV